MKVGLSQLPTVFEKWEIKTTKNQIAIEIATYIMKKIVNNNIFNNIFDLTDP